MAVLEQVPSLTATDAEAIETFARRVRETLGHHLVELRLYGSKVHGNATPESDIDVLVVIDDAEERWRLAKTVSDIAFDTNLAYGVFVSPVVLSSRDLQDPLTRESAFVRSAAAGVPL